MGRTKQNHANTTFAGIFIPLEVWIAVQMWIKISRFYKIAKHNTVDLVIFECSDFRKFVILEPYMKSRIREL